MVLKLERGGVAIVLCRQRDPHTAHTLVDCHYFISSVREAHLARVLVLEVERIARELDSARLRPLDQGRAALILGDFPKEVGREGGHCCGCQCR